MLKGDGWHDEQSGGEHRSLQALLHPPGAIVHSDGSTVAALPLRRGGEFSPLLDLTRAVTSLPRPGSVPGVRQGGPGRMTSLYPLSLHTMPEYRGMRRRCM